MTQNSKPKKFPGLRAVERALKFLHLAEESPSPPATTEHEIPPISPPFEEPLTIPVDVAEETSATRPLADEEVEGKASLPVRPPQIKVGVGYSVGMQRSHNEDAVYTVVSNLSANGRDHLFGLFAVADGMGGHQHGEVASEAAIRAFASLVIPQVYEVVFGIKGKVPETSLMELAQQAMVRAHNAVLERAPGGGTTFTAAILLGDNLTVSHVGDSRAYIIYPDGRMTLLTRDHSLVKRLEELGQLTEEEAAVHPQRNVLYRALGQTEQFDADVFTVPAPKQGYLMLCTDGLWGVISEDKIFDIVTRYEEPTEAAQRLVKAANEAGGPDNISVILVQFSNLHY